MKNMQIADIDLTNEDAMKGQFLTFKVAKGTYGVEIACVMEIVEVQDITPVPKTFNYVKGIINLRGTIVPVIDMRARFNQPEVEYTDRTCIIVLSRDELNIGLIVEQVFEVLDIDDENIQTPPKSQEYKAGSQFVRAIGTDENKQVIQLLDTDKIFETDQQLIDDSPK